MTALGRLGRVLALVGGVLLAIVGIITLVPGQIVLDWFMGLTLLIFGVGVALVMLPTTAGSGTAQATRADAHERV